MKAKRPPGKVPYSQDKNKKVGGGIKKVEMKSKNKSKENISPVELKKVNMILKSASDIKDKINKRKLGHPNESKKLEQPNESKNVKNIKNDKLKSQEKNSISLKKDEQSNKTKSSKKSQECQKSDIVKNNSVSEDKALKTEKSKENSKNKVKKAEETISKSSKSPQGDKLNNKKSKQNKIMLSTASPKKESDKKVNEIKPDKLNNKKSKQNKIMLSTASPKKESDKKVNEIKPKLKNKNIVIKSDETKNFFNMLLKNDNKTKIKILKNEVLNKQKTEEANETKILDLPKKESNKKVKKNKAESNLKSKTEIAKQNTNKKSVNASLKNNTKTEISEEKKASKRKLSGSEEITNSSTGLDISDLKSKNILKLVNGLIKLSENDKKSTKTLFSDVELPIFLTISTIKIPVVPLHVLRISLPHSLMKPNDDIVLIVKDLKKGRRRPQTIEKTIEHYEDIFKKNKITQIKTIMPFNQLKTEYGQFEMRHKLLNMYDWFLVDGRIAGHVSHFLGKTFRKKRSLPISVHMDKENLKKEIEKKMKYTNLQIHSKGTSSTVQVADCGMTPQQITENILTATESLKSKFPGGMNNIRSLEIKTPLGTSLPIYFSSKAATEVEVPVIKPKRPKSYKTVEGELSTFNSDISASVHPCGHVDLKGEINSDDDNDEEKDEGNVKDQKKTKVLTADSSNNKSKKINKKNDKLKQVSDNDENSDSEIEDKDDVNNSNEEDLEFEDESDDEYGSEVEDDEEIDSNEEDEDGNVNDEDQDSDDDQNVSLSNNEDDSDEDESEEEESEDE